MKSQLASPPVDPGTRLLRGYLHKTCNSLCGIKGYASLIARQAAGGADEVAWATKIIREVERMEAVFRTVGDLTRPSDELGPVAGLGSVVAEAAAAAAAGRPRLLILREELPEVPTLLPAADLRLVLLELLANCAEGRDGDDGAGQVSITAATEPTGRTVLRIVDDGPGLAPELLAVAADPFVTTKPDRAGVGLTRVDTLMDLHGLAWHLHSVPGVGTTVTCEVAGPLERAAAATNQGRKAQR
jgi:signal transduction histidine kinase